jgi:hypothetical protein
VLRIAAGSASKAGGPIVIRERSQQATQYSPPSGTRRPCLCRFSLYRHQEANASPAYKHGIVGGVVDGIAYTNLFTGVHGNYLRRSIVRPSAPADIKLMRLMAFSPDSSDCPLLRRLPPAAQPF